jgi:hypothetical protein
LLKALGTRRSAKLRALMRDTGLPAEAILDLALELVELASRKLSLPPIKRTAMDLGAARWRNVSAQDRSDALRRAAQARWSKHRKKSG